MESKKVFFFTLLFLGGLVHLPISRAGEGLVFDPSLYGKTLQAYLADGKVDYGSLQKHREDLDAYVRSLGEFSKKDYESMSSNEQIAFWINAYNAITLKVIVDHYPLKRRGIIGLAFPSNSIRQIPGVWDRKVLEIFGEKLSLNQIEHQILRKEFREPRVHFALVCASRGCPVLRSEPYQGDKLDTQLNEQVRGFLDDTKKARYDEATNTLYLSRIFKWFRKDFEKTGGIITFVKTHWLNETKEKISEKTGIEWLQYDWSLNERMRDGQD